MKFYRTSLITALSACLVLGLSACSGEDSGATVTPESENVTSEAPPITTPRLSAADNFRDVAGSESALSVSSGGFLVPGKVYRSNALLLDSEDITIIEDLGITKVIDLRTAQEAEDDPDTLPPGVDYVHIDVIGAGSASSQGANVNAMKVDSPDAARQMLQETNKSFVRDEGVRKAFRDVFTEIANNDGATVFHCTAGKDRAGWVSAVLQLNAGVPESEVMENYLLTNEYSQQSIKARLDGIEEKMGPEAAAAYEPLFGVEEGFLQAGLDAMKEDYGDVTGYLKDGVGLDQHTIESLRSALVE